MKKKFSIRKRKIFQLEKRKYSKQREENIAITKWKIFQLEKKNIPIRERKILGNGKHFQSELVN